MPARPLLIGASPRILHKVPAELGFHDKSLQYLEQSVAHWVMSLGALCLMLPALSPDTDAQPSRVQIQDYANMMDGLVLQGGLDIDPGMYDQPDRHIIGEPDLIRDECELELLRAFVGLGKPVLGICRGMQLINVAFGGSLHQDLIAEGATAFSHVQSALYDRHHHPVTFVEDDVLQRWYGGVTQGMVNSIHHQGIARLGEGLRPVAYAPDGVIEALWHDGDSFVLGVQWHPEFQDGSDPELLSSVPMMRAFLDAATLRRDARLAIAS